MDAPTAPPLALRSGAGAGCGADVRSGPAVRPDPGPTTGSEPAVGNIDPFLVRSDRGVPALAGCGDVGIGGVDAGAFDSRDDGAGAVETVNALLPQTQCRRCGFDACRPYAEALVRGEADINRCPPGGEATVVALARVLGRPVVPLDPACGPSGPRGTARIVESECIGCTVCIRACPVDAIIGARKWMHAVLESECTGCGLCIW